MNVRLKRVGAELPLDSTMKLVNGISKLLGETVGLKSWAVEYSPKACAEDL